MPPNTILQPPDDGDTITKILRRLDRLERSSQLQKASVTDAAGVRRLQFGDFGDGNYGIRNWDASGNLIFDSLGLIGVMKRIAFADTNANQVVAGTGSWLDLSFLVPANAQFTLTRPQNLYIVGIMSGLTSGAGGQYTFASVTDTSPNSGPITPALHGFMGIFDKSNLGFVTMMGWYITNQVPAGTYNLRLIVNPDVGQTATVFFAHADCFLMGG